MQFARIFVTATVAITIGLSAQAQQVGTYTGTTHDGSSVTIVVATDPNTSKLEVKSIAFDVGMLCRKSKETLSDVGIGLGDGSDIANDGTFSYASAGFFDIDLVTSMTFKGTNSVKGKVGVNLAAFVPAVGHTTLISDVQPCISPNQSFTATFNGGAFKHQNTNAAMILNDGKRTISVGTLPSQ